jgi:hypothetical protein
MTNNSFKNKKMKERGVTMSIKSKSAWNVNRTKSVVLVKLKEFSINEDNSQWVVRGWYNRENCFIFGSFITHKEAENFLETIHNML